MRLERREVTGPCARALLEGQLLIVPTLLEAATLRVFPHHARDPYDVTLLIFSGPDPADHIDPHQLERRMQDQLRLKQPASSSGSGQMALEIVRLDSARPRPKRA